MIAIIDYEMGNLRSVEKAFLKVGALARVVSEAKALEDANAIVLPGVGAFKDCLRNLEEKGFLEAVLKSIEKGKPYLGICLGLQVLFTESEEFGIYRGLDIFKGRVVRFNIDLKVPHMGWNTVKLVKKPPIFEGIRDENFFYFVHSFYVISQNKEIIAGTTDYGITFTSMIWKDHIFATQFHPEKSQVVGLKLLKNFWDFVRRYDSPA